MENTDSIEVLLNNLSQKVIDGKNLDAVEITKQLLAQGVEPKYILDNGLMPGIEIVGIRFRDNQIFVPQVLISARAMKSSLSLLEPLLSKAELHGMGTVVIGTVKGDIHDIGKNIVAMMLRSSGFSVIDLGIDTRAEKFIDTIKQENAQVLGMSALLTTTMPYMKTVIEKLKEEKIDVRVMVGGAPISKAFAEQIGADGYARNATEAVSLAKKLIGKN